MTKAMAYKILGITPGTDLTDIKKKIPTADAPGAS